MMVVVLAGTTAGAATLSISTLEGLTAEPAPPAPAAMQSASSLTAETVGAHDSATPFGVAAALCASSLADCVTPHEGLRGKTVASDVPIVVADQAPGLSRAQILPPSADALFPLPALTMLLGSLAGLAFIGRRRV
ncbi:MAG: hypothetical protein AAFP23_05665 [Pseudomonadota bacterium]